MTLFVSHGAPTLIDEDVPARQFLSGLAALLGCPELIVCVSAHWDTRAPRLTGSPAPATIHDFGGFPEHLYRIHYPAPGAPVAAERVAGMLRERGIPAEVDPERGLDHGAWAPLAIAVPAADIPVVQISIQSQAGPAHHYALGLALHAVAGRGASVLASGSAVHNLGALSWGAHDRPSPWAIAFDVWLAEKVAAGDVDALLDYRRAAPNAVLAHPTDEHLLPLFVALGAAGPGARGEAIHRSFTHGNLSMAAFEFR